MFVGLYRLLFFRAGRVDQKPLVLGEPYDRAFTLTSRLYFGAYDLMIHPPLTPAS